MKAYKGFNRDLTCRGFQYEVGKEYEMAGPVKLCERGFHACENPLDVLGYYGDVLSHRYCEVEQSGETVKDSDKTVSGKIRIIREIGFTELIAAGIEWLKGATAPDKRGTDDGDDYAQIGSSGYSAMIGSSGDYAQIGSSGHSAKIGSSGDSAQIGSSGNSAQIGSSGDSAKIGSSGNSAQIGSSGDSAKIGSSGDFAKIDSAGEDSVVCCAGHGSRVKAKRGSWITLSEWVYSQAKTRYVPKCVKTEYVDGERIKADTWYCLRDGEFVEAEG